MSIVVVLATETAPPVDDKPLQTKEVVSAKIINESATQPDVETHEVKHSHRK